MAESKINKLEERKRKLEEQIRDEKEKDLLKFAKWFYSKYNIDNSNEAKNIVNNYEKDNHLSSESDPNNI